MYDEPDDDEFLENDLSVDTEPVVYLLTIYPDPDAPFALADGEVESALLVLPDVKEVSLKRVST